MGLLGFFSAVEPLLWILPGPFLLALPGGRQQFAVQWRVLVCTCLAAGLVLCAAKAGLSANGGAMTIMILGQMLFAVALVGIYCFLALDIIHDHMPLAQGSTDMFVKPLLLWLIPTYLIPGMGGDGASRCWLFIRTIPVAWLLLCLVHAGWKRVQLGGLILLTVVLVMATNYFLALDAFADGSVSSFWCALYSAAIHLPLAWAAIFQF